MSQNAQMSKFDTHAEITKDRSTFAGPKDNFVLCLLLNLQYFYSFFTSYRLVS